MGLINWIFDIYQHQKIDRLQSEIAQSRAAAARERTAPAVDAAELEKVAGELALAIKTVQRVLIEKRLCSVQEFQQKLQEIDLEDGRADGRTPLR
jgi:hypothetical protein